MFKSNLINIMVNFAIKKIKNDEFSLFCDLFPSLSSCSAPNCFPARSLRAPSAFVVDAWGLFSLPNESCPHFLMI